MRLTNRLFQLVATAAMLVGATVAGAGPSGAIFTTNSNGSFVNANVYDAKGDVYLNGGPQANKPCTAAGLPDGVYVFQVTDPSGNLLSEDYPEDRRVNIVGGLIVEDPVTHHAQAPGGQCGGFTVQLIPYADTLNPGGEYKVWMTRWDDFMALGGFVHSQSKTDNFKVIAPETPDDPD